VVTERSVPQARYNDAYAGVEEQLGGFVDNIKYPPGASGMAVFINGKLTAVETLGKDLAGTACLDGGRLIYLSAFVEKSSGRDKGRIYNHVEENDIEF
jgi:hypothetical protein